MKKHKTEIMCIILALIAVMPFIIASFYAVFASDDFRYGMEYMVAPGGNAFEKTWNALVNLFLTWQGSYTSFAIGFPFNPILDVNYLALGLWMASFIVLTVIGVFFAYNELFRLVGRDTKQSYILATCTIVIATLYRDYNELYLWWIGAVVNLLPLLLLAWGLFFTFGAMRKKSACLTVVAALLMFLMSGNSLQTTGFGCYIILSTLMFFSFRDKKVNRILLIVFTAAFAGALLNVMMPGNYVRQAEQYEAQWWSNSPWVIVFNATVCITDAIVLINNLKIIVVILIAIIVGTIIRPRLSLKQTFLAMLGAVLLSYVTAFPVTLGKTCKTVWGYVNRSLFPLDLTVLTSMILIGILLFSLWRNNHNEAYAKLASRKRKILIGFSIASILACILMPPACVKVGTNLVNGNIQKFSKEMKDKYAATYDENRLVKIKSSEPVKGKVMPGTCKQLFEEDYNNIYWVIDY